jgi:signal transduction histidine kinase/ligand-binding sensor domain-containing protein/DNA-binding response OmpR family regulator
MRFFKITILWASVLYARPLSAINIDSNFRHLLFEQGLSNSNVNCIVQDADGFIWIGTENGLNRYDGYKFVQYHSNIENKFFSDDVFCSLIDHKKQLWLGTFRGLYKYLPETDNFLHIDLDFLGDEDDHKPVILALIQDSQGILWLATTGDGIIKYNPANGEYKRFIPENNNRYSISSKNILSLYDDGNDRLWLGTADSGFDCFDKNTQRFKNYQLIEGIDIDNGSNAVLTLFEKSEGIFLVGTRGGGIFEFNSRNEISTPLELITHEGSPIALKEVYGIYKDRIGRIWISSNGDGLLCFKDMNEKGIHFKHQQNNPGSLINDNVRTIFEDNQGNLWFVSYQGGINILSNKPELFKNYNFSDENPKYESKTVTSIVTDKKENIWLGTDGGGLKFINKTSGKVQHYYPGTNLQQSIPDKVIMSLMLDQTGNLWIGTYLGGLSVYNPQNKVFKNYRNTNHSNSLSSNFVSSIIEDKSGKVWVATNGKGLNLYNKTNDIFIRYSMNDTANSQSALVNDWINVMMEDNNNRIWIGTFWGLSVFDPFNGFFTNYMHVEGSKTGLSHNTIYAILESSANDIWIGTRNGLNRFEPENNSFKSYTMADGLPGNIIYAIQEDTKGNLWLSTNRGLCSFNPTTLETHSYFVSDGISGNEFFRGSSFKSETGELFFGGLDGMNSLYPESFIEDYSVPVPKITEFRIFNQALVPGQPFGNRLLLSKPIYKTDTIILKHKDNSFSFEFSALDFILPEKNNYRCKMEGFDKEWRLMDNNQRFITYTNLDAGTYVFKVKASSISNKWSNTSTNLTLIIQPPSYRTWWAYTIYYLLLAGILFLIWFISIRRITLKNQIKMERMDKEKSNELNQAKLRFFTNISHEFRTPITLIVGPLEKMMNDPALSTKYKRTIDTMMKNANRLLRLVNQLMDMRKMEFGKMQLRVEKGDLLQFIDDIHYAFKELAEQRNINFQVYCEMDDLVVWFDPEKLDKILFNLLSNAFKFTANNGEISIYVSKVAHASGKPFIRIGLEDNGRGIAEGDRDRIFERFYQPSNTYNNIGSGVGLSLTKNLVEIHHGEITFESEVNKGTLFNIYLPILEDAYAPHEKFTPEAASGIGQYVHLSPIAGLEEVEEELKVTPNNASGSTPAILIVEDNYDLRKYMVEELSELYQVIEAIDGKDGLKKAIQHLPDLIIADVMMPEMDGLEMCTQIKNNLITNHIPVILLTARNSIEHRIEGIEHGADSYIPKPFHPSHLKARISKLIELRNVLKGKYSSQLNSKEAPILQTEDLFLKKITTLILKNIDDSELNIESVSKEIGVSRGHLYRKIKLLTDKSPSEFVRLIRLNEAARLLLQKDKSVTEISYLVGFNSPSYFTICFKEHFEVAPSDFASKVNP